MEALIKSVKKHRTLWDLSLKSYKDQTKRLEAWELVAEECGLTAESAKSKWRGLRDTYIKFLKSQKPATEDGRRKRKTYCYAEQMAFMKSSLLNLNTRVTKDYEAEARIPPLVEVTEPCPPEVLRVNVVPSRKRLRQSSDSGSNSMQLTKTIEREMDATDMLFLSYSKTLKTFSRKRQILLKRKMAEIFTDAELEEMTDEESEYEPLCSFFSSSEGISNPLAGVDKESVRCKIESD